MQAAAVLIAMHLTVSLPWRKPSFNQRPPFDVQQEPQFHSLPIAWGKFLSGEVPTSQCLTFLSTYRVLVNGGQAGGLAGLLGHLGIMGQESPGSW